MPFVSLGPAPEMGGHAERVWEQERKALLGHPAIRAQDPSGTLSMALLALLQDHDLCEVFNKLPGRRHFKGTGDVGDAGGGVYCRWLKFTDAPPSRPAGTHPSLVQVLAAVGAEFPSEEVPFFVCYVGQSLFQFKDSWADADEGRGRCLPAPFQALCGDLVRVTCLCVCVCLCVWRSPPFCAVCAPFALPGCVPPPHLPTDQRRDVAGSGPCGGRENLRGPIPCRFERGRGGGQCAGRKYVQPVWAQHCEVCGRGPRGCVCVCVCVWGGVCVR